MPPHRARLLAALVGLGLALAPAHADGASGPPVCTALLTRPIDARAVQRAVTRNPASITAVCEIPKSSLDVAIAVFSIVLIPTLLSGPERYSPLELAVLRQSRDATEVLLEAGADPFPNSRSLRTPLSLAVQIDLETGSSTWTDLLLRGRSVELTAGFLRSSDLDRLFFAPALEKRLIQHGLPRHGTDREGRTWLHRSLYREDLPFEQQVALGSVIGPSDKAIRAELTLDKVLRRGVPVNRRDARGYSALYYAAWTGNWSAWDRLIAAGARLERAAEQPQYLLRALAAAGAEKRFRTTLRALHGGGHLSAAALQDLAERLLFLEGETPCRAVGRLGGSPSPHAWSSWLSPRHSELLDRALACGYRPPWTSLKLAVRARRWPAVRKMVKGADLSPRQVRVLRRMALLRGAPSGVHKALKRAGKRAKKHGSSAPRQARSTASRQPGSVLTETGASLRHAW